MRETESTTREAWVRQAVTSYEARLCRYAAGLCGDVELARDAVQETFLRLMAEDPAALNGRLKGWLYKVVRSRVLDRIRKEKRMIVSGDAMEAVAQVEGACPLALTERKEEAGRLLQALKALPQKQREAVRLKFQEEMSYRQIAEVLQVSVDHVGYLLHVGLKGKVIHRAERPAANLVFLLDVSGSMSDANKLPWVQASMRLLIDQLGPRDRVGIVTYAGASQVVLNAASGADKRTLRAAVDNLHAGGSTNGADGIRDAYRLARSCFMEEGVNRVILCTDGDFNVGTTSHDGLQSLIETEARSGVFLSVLGFGMGNYKDDTMELLSNKGNGNAAYIDTLAEAKKVLVDELAGTLVTSAKDVKAQIEFNPRKVLAYRLVGYENRTLRDRDFADDRVDAGEIGAGHAVTALYEVVPARPRGAAVAGVDPAYRTGAAFEPGIVPVRPRALETADVGMKENGRRDPVPPTSPPLRLPVSKTPPVFPQAPGRSTAASSSATSASRAGNAP